MSHLTLPFYCTVVAAFCLALLVGAIQTGAHTFTLAFLAAFAYFAWRAAVETRRCWPAFRSDMRRRADARRRDAQQRRCPPHTDTH